jgi:glycosyltransferase involved in cell wall biosynthesis
METFAGGRNVMLATGGAAEPPSQKNPNVRWIFSTSLTREELVGHGRARMHPSNGKIRLILVSRQEKAKGGGTVIQSLPLLARRFPEVRFDVVGEGSAIPEFKQLARDLGVADRVQFSGKLNHEQVLQHLGDADLFPFPTTSSDALASGLPVVATKVSVLPQLLGNGCGALLDEATPEAVARGVEEVFASPAHYEEMSCKAIETARQYSLEAWRDALGKLLTEAWGMLREAQRSEALRSLSPTVDPEP